MKKISLNLNDLPKRHKGLLLGLLISSIALFLPWYSDLDSYKSGATFLAVSGPASLIGITTLLFNLSVIFSILYAIKFKKDLINRKLLEDLAGPVYLYAALILFSIYFHPDFGLNVTQKTMSFGSYIGIFGGIVSTYSSLVFKVKDLKHANPEIVEDVLSMEDPEAKEEWEKQKQIEQTIMDRASNRIVSQDRELKGSSQKINPNNVFGNARKTPFENLKDQASPDTSNNVQGSFMYRKDL